MSRNKKNKKISLISMVVGMLPTLIVGSFSFFASLNIAKQASTIFEFILGCIVLIIMVILAFTLQVIIHELGHMIFGIITGYSFLSFRIGIFTWIKQDGKIRFKKLPNTGSMSQCLMVPPDIEDGKIPYVLYNLGGSILNMIFVIIFLLLAIFVNKGSLIFGLFVFLGLINLSFMLSNAIPIKALQNDGHNILEISKSREALRYFWIQLKITEMKTKGARLKDMPGEWFAIPSDKSMKNSRASVTGVLACFRMMDSMEFTQAEKTITKLINMDTGLITLHHNLMNVDLIYCYLVNNRLEFIPEIMDTELESFIKKANDYPSILRTQYAYALLWEKDYEKAEEINLNFKILAEKYSYSTSIESESEKILYAKEVYDKIL